MGRVRIEDVARKAGVSGATVSKAFAGLNVSESTREIVFQAARELGWTPNPHASALASGRTGTIGVVMVFYGVWYDAQMLRALEEAAASQNQDILVWTTQSLAGKSTRKDLVAAISHRVDGLVLVDFAGIPEQADVFESLSVPAVTIGSSASTLPSVSVDNRGAAALATQHLLDLGHRRIAFVGHPEVPAEHVPNSVTRLKGYVDALEAAGVEIDDELILTTELGFGGGAKAWTQLKGMPTQPTAAFCVSDEIAIGLLIAMQRDGRRPPDDLSVVGFDGHELAEHVGLTTIQQPIERLAAAALKRIEESIADVSLDPEPMILPVELVVRDSTGAVRDS